MRGCLLLRSYLLPNRSGLLLRGSLLLYRSNRLLHGNLLLLRRELLLDHWLRLNELLLNRLHRLNRPDSMNRLWLCVPVTRRRIAIIVVMTVIVV